MRPKTMIVLMVIILTIMVITFGILTISTLGTSTGLPPPTSIPNALGTFEAEIVNRAKADSLMVRNGGATCIIVFASWVHGTETDHVILPPSCKWED